MILEQHALLQLGYVVQILGEVHVDPEESRLQVLAHIVRDFSGVDKDKYQRAVTAQKKFVRVDEISLLEEAFIASLADETWLIPPETLDATSNQD